MLPDNVVQARNAAQEQSQRAGASGAAEPLISDVLKQKITEAYSASQDIIKPLDQATQTYLGAPQAGREQYQNIFNPFQRENLVSQYVGNKALPMLSLSSILGQRFGRIDDTIGAGTNAFRSQVLADQSKAEQASDLYSQLLNEYVTTEQLKSQAESERLAREKFEYDKRNSGSGGLTPEILALLGIGQDSGSGGEPEDEWEDVTSDQDVISSVFGSTEGFGDVQGNAFGDGGLRFDTDSSGNALNGGIASGKKYFEPVNLQNLLFRPR